MRDIMHQLHIDHYHSLRLLRCLQDEIKDYEAGQGWKVDLSIILEMLDYVQVYPERWHHPIEDLVFKKLIEKNIPDRTILEALLLEHSELEKETQHVVQLFNAIANDSVVPVKQLVDAVGFFVSRQISHISKENEQVYPLMEQFVTESDWEDIAKASEQLVDPLFGDELKQEYENLYLYIMETENKKRTEDQLASQQASTQRH